MALKIFVFISLVLAIIFYFLPIDKIKKDLKKASKEKVESFFSMLKDNKFDFLKF